MNGSNSRGRSFRKELERVLQIMREGDCLVVTRIDRLARSMLDFSTILNDLRSRNLGFRCTEQAIDTGALGELAMNILAAFCSIRVERQMEGIAKAKENGVYKQDHKKPRSSS